MGRLTPAEMVEYLRSNLVTRKQLRWIYRQYTQDPRWRGSHLELPWEVYTVVNTCVREIGRSNSLRIKVIGPLSLDIERRQRFHDFTPAPWARSFLWRELDKHKGDLVGELIVEALCSFAATDDVERLLDLYEDVAAHPFTRGNALYTLGCVSVPPTSRERLIRIARHALLNTTNPYARCTACMLVEGLDEFSAADVEHLMTDLDGLKPGWGPTVSQYAESAHDQLRQNRLDTEN